VRIVYTQTATATIQHILADLYETDPDAAHDLSTRFEAAADLVRQFPKIGRHGRIPDTHELIITRTRYILVYRPTASHIEIVNVRHTSRKP